jgi:hypothetical protein
VEIVDDQEATTQQIVAKAAGLLVAEAQKPDLDRVENRIVEQGAVAQLDVAIVVVGLDARQPSQALGEVIVGLWPISKPRLVAVRAVVAAECTESHPHEVKLGLPLGGSALGKRRQHTREAQHTACDPPKECALHTRHSVAQSPPGSASMRQKFLCRAMQCLW